MKVKRKITATVSALAVLTSALLTGCGTTQTGGTALSAAGILTLSINPEIQIEYNKEGLVTSLTGRNQDGEGVVSSYRDYIGKDCGVVLEDLIEEIHAAGYFAEDIDGRGKSVVLQLEPGSALPDEKFLENMSDSTRNAVKNLKLTSEIVSIDDDDYDARYTKAGQPSRYITLEKAKEIALTRAGVEAEKAAFREKEFDFNNRKAVYELEFSSYGVKYEYDVDAATGKVLKEEKSADYGDTDYGPSNDGVTDYNDTDYGPNNDGVTDYNDTDYGPNNDGVTDYNDTDYGPNNDGVTDYNDTDYGPSIDGVTDYGRTDYREPAHVPDRGGASDYDGGNSGYGGSDYGNSDYDD